jgi:hypothetical protein
LGLALAFAANFSEVPQELPMAASAPKRPDDNCTERSLTQYFSLLRPGKQKEAEEYLNQATLSFVGEEKEQL